MTEPKLVLPGDHPLWAPGAASIFQMLRVSAAISDGALWRPIHVEPNVASFELEHGVELERDRYNGAAFAQVRRTLRPFLGHYAGFSDWFVPIVVQGRLAAIVVTGPFATQRPSSTDLLERWRRLSGRVGRLSDPEFEYYVETTLSMLMLNSTEIARFGRLVVLLARLMAGGPHAGRLLSRIDALWEKLELVRLVERTWEATDQMIDERTARRWSRPHEQRGRAVLGLPAVADHVLVALFAGQKAESDRLAERLQRDAFQREAVALAKQSGHAVSGRLSNHGVLFLSGALGSARQKQRRMLDLAEKARQRARAFGLSLHAGLAGSTKSGELPALFQGALDAAERALSEGTWLAERAPEQARKFGLATLRRELAKAVAERPADSSARFAGYAEAVARFSGYRLESVRRELDSGFERISDILASRAGLEARALDDLLENLEHRARQARTTPELVVAYQSALDDLTAAAQKPSARHDHNLRRALAHIQEHYCEPLTLARVARVAGFARNYFSALFKRREGTTFEKYVLGLRLGRARDLLSTTDLDVQQVAQLSGLGTRQYLSRVFRRELGTTPSAFRKRPGAVRNPK